MTIFYPTIIALGIFSSYTDIKFRKIRNKHLFLATLLGLVTYIYLIAIQKNIININLVANVLIGTGAGLLLYFLNIWGAGDAKLFAVFCLLMPTEKYTHILPFASMVIFMNTFLLSLFIMLCLSAGQIIKHRIRLFKSIFSKDTIDMIKTSLFIVVALGWIVPPLIQFLMPHAPIWLNVLIMYFFYHTMYYAVENYETNNIFVAPAVFVFSILARFYFRPTDFMGSTPLNTIRNTLIFTFIFTFLHAILNINKSDNEAKHHIPFAPLIFLGTLLSNTNFLNSTLYFLQTVRQ